MKFNPKEILTALSVKCKGSFDDMVAMIRRGERLPDEEIAKCSDLSKNTITIIDEDYPEVFKQIDCPPLVLFVKAGHRSLLDNVSSSGVAVFDDGGECGAGEIIHGLLENGKTIVVPDFEDGSVLIEDKDHFLSVSEYPDGAYDESSREQKMRVERIAVGICNTVLIGACKTFIKASAAASLAMRAGKALKVVPMGNDKKDCINNTLLKNGADIALTWEDVLPEQSDTAKA